MKKLKKTKSLRKIIFVCMHNRFRSKVAEAYLKKINKNPRIKISSGGVFKGYPVAKSVIEVGKKFGLKINEKTKGLAEKELVDADKIIVVADNVPKDVFSSKRFKDKTIFWKIPDTSQNNKEEIGKITKKIIQKINRFKSKLLK